MKLTSPRSCSPGTIGRPPAPPAPIPREPVRRLPETTSSSGRPVRRCPRHAPDVHPSCTGLEASERPPRPHLCSLRRRDDPCRDPNRQPEAPERDRERGAHRSHRGPVVAVLSDGTRPSGAFRREPAPDLARPGRRAGAERPIVAGGWHPVREVLERSGERGRSLRASSTTGRENGRDPNAPQLEGTGEIRVESADRATGYFTTHAWTRPKVNERTAGVYWRAEPRT